MGKKKKKKGVFQWSLLALGFILGSVAVLIYFKYTELPKPVEVKPLAEVAPPVAEAPPVQAPPEEVLPPPSIPIPAPRARIAIVIDDMGPDIGKLRELFKTNVPITIAIMPNQRYSKETANEARKRGWDVILHLPMEPKDPSENDPGDGALLTAMTDEEIGALLSKDLSTVPGAIGVNNHMGSRFTEDEARMRVVLNLLKKRNMIFLDSRTTPNSVAGRLSRELGVRSAERNVFLDNTRDVGYIKGQISELVRIARRRGSAIGIGHPYPETIEALKGTATGFDDRGVRVDRKSVV